MIAFLHVPQTSQALKRNALNKLFIDGTNYVKGFINWVCNSWLCNSISSPLSWNTFSENCKSGSNCKDRQNVYAFYKALNEAIKSRTSTTAWRDWAEHT